MTLGWLVGALLHVWSLVGNNVSHAKNKTKRRWLPNLQKIKVRLQNGTVKYMRVCTQCIKSDKIVKAA